MHIYKNLMSVQQHPDQYLFNICSTHGALCTRDGKLKVTTVYMQSFECAEFNFQNKQ